ncbi:MAG: nucleoside-diphosphate sugar epimerase/dehydratase [Thermodesulfobacteriota bacterium]
MSRYRNLVIMLGLDAGLAWLSLYCAYLIRFEFSIPAEFAGSFHATWPWLLPVKIFCFAFFGLYRGMWRYTSLVDLMNLLKAVFTGSLIAVAAILMVYRFEGYPRSAFILDGVLTFLFAGGLRMVIRLRYAGLAGWRVLPVLSRLKRKGFRELLVVGAGDAAEKVIREIQDHPDLGLEPIGLLDDNPAKKGKSIHGVPVLGPIDLLSDPPMNFDEILIAAPSAKGEEMRRIVRLCETSGRTFRTIPGMGELINGRVTLKAVRQVRVEDLLGREELHLNREEIARYLRGRRVLVTGAGGSIGSELVRQIGLYRPKALALFEVSELNLFQVKMELGQRFPELQARPFLADIRDREAVAHACREFEPEVLFHAAAYKHVPMQELFPWEAVSNNVLGSSVLVEAALAHGVSRLVLVSTDKAVRPTSVMGATKRVAERLMECGNQAGPTRFMAVRFGNVMGSSGSAIPIFREQIARGGPVTVTHPEVTRYFMSVGEAAELILQAGAIGQGGEIFVLKMGRPIKILELVRDMIRLHGYEPDKDIKIEFIGLRPGEKLYEELITAGEGLVPTGHDKIMVLKGNAGDYNQLQDQINELLAAAQSFDPEAIKSKLKALVPEYTPGP